MEPAAAAISLVAFGLKSINGITQYYQSFASAKSSVKHALATASSLEHSLELLQTQLQNPSLDKDIVERIEKDVQACNKHFKEIHDVLQNVLSADAKEGGFKYKAVSLSKQVKFPFKESTLQKIKDQCGDVHRNLAFALQVLQT